MIATGRSSNAEAASVQAGMLAARSGSLDLRSVSDHPALRYDDYPLADEIRAVLGVHLFHAGWVQQLYVLTDPHVFVHDRPSDQRVRPDADVRHASVDVLPDLVDRLEKIRAHNDRILYPHAGVQAAPQADNGIPGKDAVQDAPLADHRIVNVAGVQLRRGQVPAAGVDGCGRVEEIEL